MPKKHEAHVQVTVRPKDLDRAHRVLRRVEEEIAKDWRYADYPCEALDDIKALAEALRARARTSEGGAHRHEATTDGPSVTATG